MGYVGNVICLKFVQESFKVLFEKELVKNMMYLLWELNPRLLVHAHLLPVKKEHSIVSQDIFSFLNQLHFWLWH